MADNFKKQIEKKCKFCKKTYIASTPFKTLCSPECQESTKKERAHKQWEKNKEKLSEYRKWHWHNTGKERLCKSCKKPFFTRRKIQSYCSFVCSANHNVKKGKDSHSYKHGLRMNGKNYGAKHYKATREYGIKFVDKNGYKFCEHCNINNSLRFETHHIVFASEKPKHKELHNTRNLIMLCIKCHNFFHGGKTHERRSHLVVERKLDELFGKDVL